MPTPDQCNGSTSTEHAGKDKNEIMSNQSESDCKRFAVHLRAPYIWMYMCHRNKIIQDLLERKQKELSGSLLASYFYNCMCKHFYKLLILYCILNGLCRVVILQASLKSSKEYFPYAVSWAFLSIGTKQWYLNWWYSTAVDWCRWKGSVFPYFKVAKYNLFMHIDNKLGTTLKLCVQWWSWTPAKT